MKLGLLNENCGRCKIISCCGEPFSEVCLCANEKLQNVEEDDYLNFYNECFENQEMINKAIELMAIQELGEK